MRFEVGTALTENASIERVADNVIVVVARLECEVNGVINEGSVLNGEGERHFQRVAAWLANN